MKHRYTFTELCRWHIFKSDLSRNLFGEGGKMPMNIRPVWFGNWVYLYNKSHPTGKTETLIFGDQKITVPKTAIPGWIVRLLDRTVFTLWWLIKTAFWDLATYLMQKAGKL